MKLYDSWADTDALALAVSDCQKLHMIIPIYHIGSIVVSLSIVPLQPLLIRPGRLLARARLGPEAKCLREQVLFNKLFFAIQCREGKRMTGDWPVGWRLACRLLTAKSNCKLFLFFPLFVPTRLKPPPLSSTGRRPPQCEPSGPLAPAQCQLVAQLWFCWPNAAQTQQASGPEPICTQPTGLEEGGCHECP